MQKGLKKVRNKWWLTEKLLTLWTHETVGVHSVFADELAVHTREFLETSSMITLRNAISIFYQMFLDLGMNFFRDDVEENN